MSRALWRWRAAPTPTAPITSPAQALIIGGLTGAAAGQIIGGEPARTVIGTAVGAAIGGAIAGQLQAQERELQQSLAGSGQ